jgi:hypothetical protein
VPKAPGFLDEADLVIAMDNSIRGSLERRGLSKLEVFHEYFGPCEELKDPWPDYHDDASIRYEGGPERNSHCNPKESWHAYYRCET